MEHGRIVCAILGFSASFILCLPNIWRWQTKKIKQDKLRLVSEALQQAEERAGRYEERHDRILSQICSNYFISQYADEGLAGARGAVNDAQEFVALLRNLQIELLATFPGADISVIEYLGRKLSS